eukprot:31010-Pelagococcus_subviridis.AAC.3
MFEIVPSERRAALSGALAERRNDPLRGVEFHLLVTLRLGRRPGIWRRIREEAAARRLAGPLANHRRERVPKRVLLEPRALPPPDVLRALLLAVTLVAVLRVRDFLLELAVFLVHGGGDGRVPHRRAIHRSRLHADAARLIAHAPWRAKVRERAVAFKVRTRNVRYLVRLELAPRHRVFKLDGREHRSRADRLVRLRRVRALRDAKRRGDALDARLRVDEALALRRELRGGALRQRLGRARVDARLLGRRGGVLRGRRRRVAVHFFAGSREGLWVRVDGDVRLAHQRVFRFARDLFLLISRAEADGDVPSRASGPRVVVQGAAAVVAVFAGGAIAHERVRDRGGVVHEFPSGRRPAPGLNPRVLVVLARPVHLSVLPEERESGEDLAGRAPDFDVSRRSSRERDVLAVRFRVQAHRRVDSKVAHVVVTAVVVGEAMQVRDRTGDGVGQEHDVAAAGRGVVKRLVTRERPRPVRLRLLLAVAVAPKLETVLLRVADRSVVSVHFMTRRVDEIRVFAVL